MIKVFFDWNVMSQMKNGKHEALKSILMNNDKLFMPFSTAHIGDIFSSFKETEEQANYIKSDLSFIIGLTRNKWLYNESNDIVLDLLSARRVISAKGR